MPAYVNRDDTRIVRTIGALNAAMASLLKERNFRKITVGDLCASAQISRTTFYTHFKDKYCFLKFWLNDTIPAKLSKHFTYEQTKRAFNDFVFENQREIKNIIYDTDEETLEIIYEFILTLMDFSQDRDGKTDPEASVLTHFYAGGLVAYLLWQIKHRFPPEITPMNRYVYDIMQRFRRWEAERAQNSPTN